MLPGKYVVDDERQCGPNWDGAVRSECGVDSLALALAVGRGSGVVLGGGGVVLGVCVGSVVLRSCIGRIVL